MQGGCRSIDSGTKFLWLFVTFSGFTLWDSHPNNSPTLTLWTHPRLWLGEKLVHNGWVRFILLCCTDQCVLSALEDRQTHTSKVCTAPGVCRDLGSNWEMRSTQQQGLSGEFKDPSAIAPRSGQFCWKIYTLINPTFHFYPEQCCKELVQWPSDTAPSLLVCFALAQRCSIDAGRAEHLHTEASSLQPLAAGIFVLPHGF